MEKNSKKLSRKSREHLSWQLIFSAYFIEVCLILISVITAITITDTSQSSKFLLSSVLLAVLLSLVEPLKILAAQSLVILNSFKGRYLAFALLIFATAISFENISQTVKMAQKNLTNPIDIRVNEAINYENQILIHKSDIRKIAEKSPPMFEIERSKLLQNNEEIKYLQNQIKSIKSNNNRSQIMSLELNIKSLRENINSLNARQDDLQIKCFDKREGILKLMTESVNKRLFGRSSREEMYSLELDSLDRSCSAQLKNIKDLTNTDNLQLSKVIQNKQQLFQLSAININQISELENKISELENLNKKIIERDFAQTKDKNLFEADKLKEISRVESLIKTKELKLSSTIKKINELKSDSILYSIAATFYQIPTDKISAKQFEFFLSIWLLILSSGLCFIPAILAIIGEVVVVESDSESLFSNFFTYLKDKKAIKKEVEGEMSQKILKTEKEAEQSNRKVENLEDEIHDLRKKDKVKENLLLKKSYENEQLENKVYALEREKLHSSIENESLNKKLKMAQKDKKNKIYIPVPLNTEKTFEKAINKLYKRFFESDKKSKKEEKSNPQNITHNNIKEIEKWKKK